MRLVARFARKDNRANSILNEFNSAVALLKRELMFLDRLELWLCSEDKTFLEGRHARILLNTANPFFHDSGMIRSFLLQNVFQILAMRKGENGWGAKISGNRDMIKSGHEKELVFYYYTLLVSGHGDTKLLPDAIASWLSFYGIDDYNCRLFEEMISMLGYRKIFEGSAAMLSAAIRNNDFDRAAKVYRQLVRNAGNKV